MDNPISPFEKWRLESIPQVGFTPEIRELLAMAFEGGRQSVAEKHEWQSLSDDMEKAKFYDESFYNGARWAEQILKEKNHG